MVKIDGVDINITEELKQVLLQNPPKKVQKSVIARKRDDKGDLVQEKDDAGNPKFVEAVIDTHPVVYFDAYGNYYFRAFKTAIVDGREVIVTNPKIETKKDCALYATGVVSHHQIIPGSELWDNGSDTSMQHRETISKGNPLTKIVKVMTRDEVLAVDIKPTGDSLIAKIANSSDVEKAAILEQLIGKDAAKRLSNMLSDE